MCPLLVPASKGKCLLFFSFFVAAAIDSTTEANKAPLSSLYSLDVYELDLSKPVTYPPSRGTAAQHTHPLNVLLNLAAP
jgi:hypothetical protein